MMLDDLLPAGVSSSVRTRDIEGFLSADEAHIVRNAVETRRREFTTARMCAREALEALGFPPAEILQDERRAPIWPEGVVGSITHCSGFRAAAVARSTVIRSLGIDAEPQSPLPDGLAELVLTSEEQTALRSTREVLPNEIERLIFVIKESIYKAWYPLTRAWLGFQDVTVTVAADGAASARRHAASDEQVASPQEFYSRWKISRGLILASTVIPRDTLEPRTAACAEKRDHDHDG
ncbi:4'-phosphopantetheinyl transferase family protein [Microbacterium enclense]|uniref:4'-phosphopantetheinyl transferase family protein n=1 Tax=Microbacterium enclense TaxID=993073 RepID=UPI003F7D9AFD